MVQILQQAVDLYNEVLKMAMWDYGKLNMILSVIWYFMSHVTSHMTLLMNKCTNSVMGDE